MSSILIVDDDLDGSEPLARYLRRAGHRVLTAPNGREALALLTGALPDLVVLDMRMPEMDGVDFLHVLRSYLRWKDLPVIAVTAYSEGPHIDRARQLGIDAVFAKVDLDFAAVVERAEQVLRDRQHPGDDQGGPSSWSGAR